MKPSAHHAPASREAPPVSRPNAQVPPTEESVPTTCGPSSAPRGGNSSEYAGTWWPEYQPLSHSRKPDCAHSPARYSWAARSLVRGSSSR